MALLFSACLPFVVKEQILDCQTCYAGIYYSYIILELGNVISQLRLAGYDHAISIEHEDGLMSRNEGLVKSIEALKQIILFDEPGEMYWA